ncbi:MAG: carboxypeptidase regulatory-like domain-containing protein [Bryobacterales bacterium]|nr:carboxypeptidase regulatory-like domain-containing protein [Bryobacterales bacterium]
MRAIAKFTLVFSAAALFAEAAYAQQVSGSITGIVKDDQGAMIPNAKISLYDTRQGDLRAVATNADGIFLFNPLKPSIYNLTVEHAGFKKFEQKLINVFANDRIALPDLVLQIGGVTETITVEETSVQLHLNYARFVALTPDSLGKTNA